MTSNIATLASLYTEITRLMDGEDVDISDVSVETMSRLVVVAQKRIYRDVRCRFNEKAFSGVTVSGNLATFPSDFKAISIIHFGRAALVPVPEAVLRDYAFNSSGNQRYVARAGSSMTFWPQVSDGTAVQGRYYFAWPDLANGNFDDNLLFQESDDLFIYAALVESGPFFGENEKMPIWQGKYLSIATELNKEGHRTTYQAGRLMQRPSIRICGRQYGPDLVDSSGSGGGFDLSDGVDIY